MEKLLHFLSKVFLLNFPLYAAHKQSLQTKMEELTQQEASLLSNFCDVHDVEIPLHLLQNVCLFCRWLQIHTIVNLFEYCGNCYLYIRWVGGGEEGGNNMLVTSEVNIVNINNLFIHNVLWHMLFELFSATWTLYVSQIIYLTCYIYFIWPSFVWN